MISAAGSLARTIVTISAFVNGVKALWAKAKETHDTARTAASVRHNRDFDMGDPFKIDRGYLLTVTLLSRQRDENRACQLVCTPVFEGLEITEVCITSMCNLYA